MCPYNLVFNIFILLPDNMVSVLCIELLHNVSNPNNISTDGNEDYKIDYPDKEDKLEHCEAKD